MGTAQSSRSGTVQRTPRLRRLLLVALLTLATGYVAMCVGVCHFQERLIYFPDARHFLTPAAVRLDYEEVRLTAEDGVPLLAWLIPRDDARGTILVCGGNGGNMTEVVETAKTLHGFGFQIMLFDYRGYGGSGGQPSEAGLYRDAEAAWRYLLIERGIPAQQLVIFGRSLGGGVAIELAHRQPPAALIVESTFTSLAAVGQREYPFLPVYLLTRNRYESIRKVPHLRCPKLFLHGRDDEIIPLALGQALFAAAAEPKEFIETPGRHNNSGLEYNHETTRQVGAWLDQHIPRP